MELPEKEFLPIETKKLVISRQDVKRTPKNRDLQLPIKIREIINSGKLPGAFSSKDIWGLLSGDVQVQVKIVRITDLLNKGLFRQLVAETGKKRGREKLFMLK